MELPPGLLHIFAQTRLYTDEQEYVMSSIPLSRLDEVVPLLTREEEFFSALVVDRDELTLVLPLSVWKTIREQLLDIQESTGYRLITSDLPLELGLVGYIATLTGVLADAGVSLFAFSAYQRDHFLVPGVDFEQAWGALNTFIGTCREMEQKDS